jgi:hypothetical protein
MSIFSHYTEASATAAMIYLLISSVVGRPAGTTPSPHTAAAVSRRSHRTSTTDEPVESTKG